MNKPNGFDNTNPWSNFEPLKPGGYVCRILNAKEETSKAGNPMVVVMLDICEGEHKEHFTQIYKARKEAASDPFSVKYPFDGIAYIITEWDGKTTQKFKALCTAVENSGRTIAWGEKFCESLKGAEIGVIFRREETKGYGDNADKTFWNTKPFAFRTADTIREGKFTVPEDKPLQNEQAQSVSIPEQIEGFREVASSEFVPF